MTEVIKNRHTFNKFPVGTPVSARLLGGGRVSGVVYQIRYGSFFPYEVKTHSGELVAVTLADLELETVSPRMLSIDSHTLFDLLHQAADNAAYSSQPPAQIAYTIYTNYITGMLVRETDEKVIDCE